MGDDDVLITSNIHLYYCWYDSLFFFLIRTLQCSIYSFVWLSYIVLKCFQANLYTCQFVCWKRKVYAYFCDCTSVFYLYINSFNLCCKFFFSFLNVWNLYVFSFKNSINVDFFVFVLACSSISYYLSKSSFAKKKEGPIKIRMSPRRIDEWKLDVRVLIKK